MLNQLERSVVLTEVTDRTILDDIFALRVTAWRDKVVVAPGVTQWIDAIDGTRSLMFVLAL